MTTLKRPAVEMPLAFGIGLLAIVLLHRPSLSPQTLIMGNGEFPALQMALLKGAVGLITSLVIFGICRVTLRQLTFAGIIGALLAQLIWIEFEWGFSVSARDNAELAIRFAEEFGSSLAGASAAAYLKLRTARPSE
jgi:hypothetical protein